MRCDKCGYEMPLCGVTDRELAPVNRTEANLWRARYFEALHELTRANKGIRRLRAGRDKRVAREVAAERARLVKSAVEIVRKWWNGTPEYRLEVSAVIHELEALDHD